MTFWWWVLLFGGIALAASGSSRMLGLRLWRKAKVLLAELAPAQRGRRHARGAP